MTQTSPIKPIAMNAPTVFEALKQRQWDEQQKEITEKKIQADDAKKLLKDCIPKFIDIINKAITNNKGEMSSTADLGKFAEYKLSLGDMSDLKISKIGLLCILGVVYTEFKNAGWDKFSISFTTRKLDNCEHRTSENALNYFTVTLRVFETFEPHIGIGVTDYGDDSNPSRYSHSGPPLLKSYYLLKDIPEIDALDYKQLFQKR